MFQSGAYVGGGGFDFGITKLVEGVGYKDPAADRHMAAILAQPIIPGGYGFGRPDLNPGTAGAYAEADWLWTVASSYGGARGMLLALDAESASGSAQWCDDYLGRLSWRVGGYNGLLYSYLAWMESRGLIGSPVLQRSALWFAWPSQNGGLPFAVAMQQYGTGSVPGLGGAVDLNVFFDDRAQLERLTIGGGKPQEDDMLPTLMTGDGGGQPPDGKVFVVHDEWEKRYLTDPRMLSAYISRYGAVQTMPQGLFDRIPRGPDIVIGDDVVEDPSATQAELGTTEQLVTALKAEVDKLVAGSGGAVDLTPVTDQLAKLSAHLGVGTA